MPDTGADPFRFATRLEPYSRIETLEGGLRAAIHDPLWLLARQWQFGEFIGEDAGSPVYAELWLTRTRLTQYQPGGVPGRPITSFDAAIPLEAQLEREPIRREDSPRLAAEAGLHFLRVLQAHEAGTLSQAVRQRFPLQIPAEDPQRPIDPECRRFLLVAGGRVPDGALLYAIFSVSHEPGVADPLHTPYQQWKNWVAGLSRSEQQNVENAVGEWKKWYRDWFLEPDASGAPAWIPERLEYRATVAAPMRPPQGRDTPRTEIVLVVPEYTGQHLDWYSFNIAPAGSLSAQNDTGCEPDQQITMPSHVTFRGMPASRYWEFEDARIDFGAIDTGGPGLVELLLMEFGLVSGDDWFLLPVTLRVGSICRIDWLMVSDTFGERTKIESTRAVDGNRGAPGWGMFRLSVDRRRAVGASGDPPDVLFLPPVLDGGLAGAPMEDVLFLRDEMANMAWAVERLVSPMGERINCSEEYFKARRQREQPGTSGTPDTSGSALPIYRLITDVPPHWIPLLRIAGSLSAMGLQRGATGRWSGRIVAEVPDTNAPTPLREEEVPREGARVTRAFQYARWTGGETYLWLGREKGVGRGEGSSGVKFDTLASSEGEAP